MQFYNLTYEINDPCEAKFTGQVTKYQKKSCIVLLQSEIMLY